MAGERGAGGLGAGPSSGRADVELTCIGVRAETPTIKTFVFKVSGPEPISHEAGQAITLAMPIDGQTLYRTFSLSSAPSTDGTVEVTVKAHPQGHATAWLHRTVEAGTVLATRRPHGRFTLARRTGKTLALVSAGSGATPLMAMLRHLARTEPLADVAWLHAARDPGEVLFAAELATLQAAMPNLSVSITVSRPQPGWFGLRGRLTRRLASVAVPDLARRDVFCCGPTAFMDDARLIYVAEGGRREAFHTETFGIAGPVVAPVPDISDEPGAAFDLRIGARTLKARADETILQAALRQGVVIPCGCGQGLCGTCRILKLSGEVEMHHQGGLAPDEEREGYILACSSRLRSDAEISL